MGSTNKSFRRFFYSQLHRTYNWRVSCCRGTTSDRTRSSAFIIWAVGCKTWVTGIIFSRLVRVAIRLIANSYTETAAIPVVPSPHALFRMGRPDWTAPSDISGRLTIGWPNVQQFFSSCRAQCSVFGFFCFLLNYLLSSVTHTQFVFH